MIAKFYVGNTMIDTLYNNQSRFTKPLIWDQFKLKEKEFIVITMHRLLMLTKALN